MCRVNLITILTKREREKTWTFWCQFGDVSFFLNFFFFFFFLVALRSTFMGLWEGKKFFKFHFTKFLMGFHKYVNWHYQFDCRKLKLFTILFILTLASSDFQAGFCKYLICLSLTYFMVPTYFFKYINLDAYSANLLQFLSNLHWKNVLLSVRRIHNPLNQI